MTGDLCYVLRGLRRRPGFAATIVVTLTLGPRDLADVTALESAGKG
jgi:hypothetical protein